MHDTKPRVSIGLPVYNGERYLREALDTILAQTFRDFELIISDNASTDGTLAICKAYAASDARIRYLRNEQNLGATRNYNRTFEVARGEYFKWAAHDDLMAPEFLERCVTALDQNPAAVVSYPIASFIDKNGQLLGQDFIGLSLRSPRPPQRYAEYHQRFRRSRKCNPVFGLMRSSALRPTPLIGNYVSSDEVLLAELALRGEFCEIPKALFFRRDHPESSVRKYRDRDRIVWFDPSKQGQLHFPAWCLLQGHASAIIRVPMGVSEKLLCWAELGKWGLRKKRALYSELLFALKYTLRPLPAFIKLIVHGAWRVIRDTVHAIHLGVIALKRQPSKPSDSPEEHGVGH